MAKGKGNNTAGRVKISNYRTLNGKTVRPVLYAGRSIGHGHYMAGMVDDVLVIDKNGIPIPYKQINDMTA